jgi:hypothetical protein
MSPPMPAPGTPRPEAPDLHINNVQYQQSSI